MLLDGAAELGIPLTKEQLDQFAHYGDLLTEWNQRLNLTRVPPKEYIILHFLDSLAAAAAVSFSDSIRGNIYHHAWQRANAAGRGYSNYGR